MKKQYNNLENNLKKGLCVTVKDLSDNTYCSILNHKDKNGNYRISGWISGCWGSMEESKQYIGEYSGNTKQDWNNKDLEIVEVYRPEEEMFKIGDRVRLLDSIKETDDWESCKDDFPEMKGKIEETYNNISGRYYKVSGWYVRHEYLAPLVEEQEDNVALEAIKLLEEKGYKIVKK